MRYQPLMSPSKSNSLDSVTQRMIPKAFFISKLEMQLGEPTGSMFYA